MKIDNADQGKPIDPRQPQKPVSADGGSDFAQVLEQTVHQSNSSNVMPNSTIQSVRPTDFALPSEHIQLAVNQTGEILDTLESYRQLLADPATSLRQIQPVVDDLGQEMLKMESSMRRLPRDHAVKLIMEETLIQVGQEIERFNQGTYIA